MRNANGVRSGGAVSPESGLPPHEVFAAAIDLLNRELLPESSAKRQRLYAKAARVLAALQRRAQRQTRSPASRTPGSASASSTDLDLRAWGSLLRRRREAAGLTRAQLAVLAGVADSTIRNIETGRHAPTRTIALRLQAVPALKLPEPFSSQTPTESPAPTEPISASSALRGHGWITPDFDSVAQSRDLARLLSGRGGRLDPALLFLDPASAADWCALAAAGKRLRERTCMPLADVAHAVSACLAPVPLDVLGLGAGEAHAETSLTLALCASSIPSLRLLLLDSSPSLLVAGFRHASSALASSGRAACFAVQGDMRRLPSYGPLLETPRHRLVCLFGDTFSTLDNEATFTQHSLGALVAGDLLLLDVQCALIEPQDEPHLRAKALAQPEEAPLVEFLTGPLHRNIKAMRSVELRAALDHTACIIPGSYAVEYLATVHKAGRDPRRFSLYHAKRYDPERLAQSLAHMGWDLVERWPFGAPLSPRALLLLQKRA